MPLDPAYGGNTRNPQISTPCYRTGIASKKFWKGLGAARCGYHWDGRFSTLVLMYSTLPVAFGFAIAENRRTTEERRGNLRMKAQEIVAHAYHRAHYLQSIAFCADSEPWHERNCVSNGMLLLSESPPLWHLIDDQARVASVACRMQVRHFHPAKSKALRRGFEGVLLPR